MRFARKTVVFSAISAAAVLCTASAAFACITLAGKITVTPPAGRTASNQIIADNSASMTYCTGHGLTTPATAKNGESITYTLRPTVSGDPCFSSTNHLNGSTSYEVRINNTNNNGNGTQFPWTKSGTTWSFTANSGCYFGSTPTGDLQGTFTTTASGSSLNTSDPAFTLSLANNNINGASDASLVCVGASTSPGSNPGAFSALQVVSV